MYVLSDVPKEEKREGQKEKEKGNNYSELPQVLVNLSEMYGTQSASCGGKTNTAMHTPWTIKYPDIVYPAGVRLYCERPGVVCGRAPQHTGLN
ncbi:hypothetical protein NECAME_15608 [Necator americanus]|uniref:Uncharacterized protein n=1 Tax=Necator americanus TaxID=51031 RepID=W2SGU6_NECAM|nr:hypothetical protein NECAME_15608 [Necator americanus]ETN68810.1 hypothetical protein NECAME_15608 [Necator americanus]